VLVAQTELVVLVTVAVSVTVEAVIPKPHEHADEKRTVPLQAEA